MTDTPQSERGTLAGATPAEIDLSCRLPLMVLFISAAIWLVIASVFGVIASLKFHSPQFLAECPWMTYGRVRPAFTNSLLYGFCIQAGLGVSLWLISRLGQTRLAQPWLITVGAKFWNLGVTAGVIGILAGDGTGFEYLELPQYASILCFVGYVLSGLWGVITFHQRRERSLFASQWFLFAALFWFPWIFSTANLLLVSFPVRGMTQAVIAWWYSNNLLFVWLGLVGLGAVFYFVPKLKNWELHSHYLALFTFWTLILFATWGGIPRSAAVPAWMPALSTVTTVLTLVPLLAVLVNVKNTVGGRPSPAAATPSDSGVQGQSKASKSVSPAAPEGGASFLFVLFGVGAFVLAGFLNIGGVLLDSAQELHFTWFVPARTELQFYGFFTMVMFGAIYYIFPRVCGIEFPFAKLVKAHFGLAAIGILVYAVPLVIGGIVQAGQLQDAKISAVQMAQSSLPFLRASTLGDVLMLLGHLAFLINIGGLVTRFYRARMTAAYSVATADLFKAAEVKP